MDQKRTAPAPRPTCLIRGDLALLAGGPGGLRADEPDGTTWIAQAQALSVLYLAGMRRLLVVATEAPADPAATDPAGLARFNRLLASRGLAAVELRRAGAGSAAARALSDHAGDILRTRRRRLLPDLPADDDPQAALAALQAGDADRPGALFAVAPVIDPARCSGCDACLRVCPTGALSHVNDGTGTSCYATSGANCTACGLCVELCAENAIELAAMTPRPAPVALDRWTCPACGVPVHAPSRPADGLCPICRSTGHHRKLFQVWPS